MRLAFVAILAGGALAGCYAPNVTRCAIRCERGQTCPDGYACNGDDGYCHEPDDSERCEPKTFELTIDRVGVGSGRFLGRDGLDCTDAHCVVQAQEGPYTITTVPDPESRVTGWSIIGLPVCGSDDRCTFDLLRDTTVDVGLGAGRNLTVQLAGRGNARVATNDGAILCDFASAPCTAGFDVGTTVTLEAQPANLFVGWTGACEGSDPICTVALAQSAQVTARFDVVRVQFVPVPSDGGTLDISSSRGSLQCPPSCEVDFPLAGDSITMTALPARGFELKSWFNNPCEKAALVNPCGPIDVTGDTAMIALFAELPP